MQQYKFIDEPKKEGGKPQHIHTLDGKPLMGVTTILNVLDKPLTWWASSLAVAQLGWIHSKELGQQMRTKIAAKRQIEIAAMSPDEYLACLDKAYRAHADESAETAEAGKEMHSELEFFVKNCIENHSGKPIPFYESKHNAVQLFANWAKDNIETLIASEVHCFSEELWVGGIVDLIYEDKEGNFCILDFKSAKEAYLTHFLQNAAYDILLQNGGFDKNGTPIFPKDGGITFSRYAVLPFRMENPEPQFNDKFGTIAELKEGFKCCIPIYKLMGGKKKWGAND
jgi:hypothetical protein